MRLRLLALLLVPALASSAHAGLFPWRKTEKPDPKTRVPELVTTLQTDKDEHKRSRAAEELRNYDATQHPEIVPSLISALLTDTRQGVRIDAAQSLGKIRPVSQAAGEALEQALEKDPSMRVRLQARSVLLGYHWAGYRSGKKGDAPPPAVTTTAARPAAGGPFLPPIRTTQEPPLAAPDAPAVKTPTAPPAKTTEAKPLGDGPILP